MSDETRVDPTTEEQPGDLTHRTPAHGRHPVHIPHLVMGVALLGLVTVWALVVPLDAVNLHHARWLLPLPWLVAGAVGLAATLAGGRRRP